MGEFLTSLLTIQQVALQRKGNEEKDLAYRANKNNVDST